MDINKNEIMEKIIEASQQVEEKMLIDDIIDIYNGRWGWKTYSDYKVSKERETRYAEANNEKKWNKSEIGEMRFSYYPYPTILSIETFLYIQSKARKDKVDK